MFPIHSIILLPRPRRISWDAARPAAGRSFHSEPAVTVDAAAAGPEGYFLRIDASGVAVTAGGPAGVFYARQTLKQLTAQIPEGQGEVPALEIADEPEFSCRGVMLDVSRDRIPTMPVLKRFIDRLSSWKVNFFTLYLEHTFAYEDHAEVWSHASPFTAAEIRELDAYCRERFIDFAPFQNSLGHMLRWLCHDRYRPLAECPQGFQSSWNMAPTDPFSLCPTDPASLEFMDSLLEELLPNFTSCHFIAGCDETYDIGEGRSREACEKYGRERVYLDYIAGLNRVVRKHGRRMMICADILINHPELVREMPRDIAMVDWGYGMDYDFRGHGERMRRAGLEFYFMISNSTYSSAAGRTYRGMGNIRNAAFAAMETGAAGLINTEWGDFGHWHTWSAALPGMAYGAAMSWAPEANAGIDLGAAMDFLVYGAGTGVGDLILDLGRMYVHTAGADHACALFMMFYYLDKPRGEAPLDRLTGDNLRLVRGDLELLEHRAGRLDPGKVDPGVMLDVRQMIRFTRFACDCAEAWLADPEALTLNRLKPEVQRELAARFSEIIEAHCELWRRRHRPGGLTASLWWYRRAWRNVAGEVPFPFDTEVKRLYGDGETEKKMA